MAVQAVAGVGCRRRQPAIAAGSCRPPAHRYRASRLSNARSAGRPRNARGAIRRRRKSKRNWRRVSAPAAWAGDRLRDSACRRRRPARSSRGGLRELAAEISEWSDAGEVAACAAPGPFGGAAFGATGAGAATGRRGMGSDSCRMSAPVGGLGGPRCGGGRVHDRMTAWAVSVVAAVAAEVVVSPAEAAIATGVSGGGVGIGRGLCRRCGEIDPDPSPTGLPRCTAAAIASGEVGSGPDVAAAVGAAATAVNVMRDRDDYRDCVGGTVVQRCVCRGGSARRDRLQQKHRRMTNCAVDLVPSGFSEPADFPRVLRWAHRLLAPGPAAEGGAALMP